MLDLLFEKAVALMGNLSAISEAIGETDGIESEVAIAVKSSVNAAPRLRIPLFKYLSRKAFDDLLDDYELSDYTQLRLKEALERELKKENF